MNGICYYHNDSFAVATCAKCGRFLCENCAIKSFDGRILCRDCANDSLYEQHEAEKKAIKERGGRFINGFEFLIASGIGIVIVILFFSYIHFVQHDFVSMLSEPEGIAAVCVVAIWFHCIPYGFIWLSDVFSPHVDSFLGHMSSFFGRIFLGLAIGWIVFIIFLIRFLVRKHSRKKAR